MRRHERHVQGTSVLNSRIVTAFLPCICHQALLGCHHFQKSVRKKANLTLCGLFIIFALVLVHVDHLPSPITTRRHVKLQSSILQSLSLRNVIRHAGLMLACVRACFGVPLFLPKSEQKNASFSIFDSPAYSSTEYSILAQLQRVALYY